MGIYRIFLAVFVALSHMGFTFYGLNPGVTAVVSFLIISGFVMTALINRYYLKLSAVPAFYMDRMLRIQPQYLFYLIATAVCFYSIGISSPFLTKLNAETLALNALIIPANFYMFSFFDGRLMIPPAWSLGLEVCFYLVIPFLLIYRLRVPAFFLSVLFFMVAYYGVINTDWYGYRFLPGTLFIFLLGSFLHEKSKGFILISTYILTCVFLVLTLFFDFKKVPFNPEVLLGIVIGLPAVYWLSKVKLGRIDHALGNISYGLFLNHFLLIWIFQRFGIQEPNYWQAIGLIFLSFSLASLSYYLVERPAVNFRRKIRKHEESNVLTAS